MAKKISWFQYLLLALILLVAARARLYRVDNPVADWHSWRQADTASVSRNFYQDGINLLIPRYDDISSLPSGKANPEGYRMVEFPLYNALHASLAHTGWWSFDQTGRILSICLSLLTIVALFGVVRLLSGPATALLSAFFLAVLPFSIYYSRVILPDPLMTALWLMGTWAFLSGYFNSKRQTLALTLSAGLFGLGIVVRPYLFFFLIPILVLSLTRWKLNLLKNWRFWAYLVALVLPFVLWRRWISQFPEGIPASGFLFNFSNLRFGPAWFRWLFGERLGHLILGGWGLIPLSLGLLSKSTKKENWFYQLWFLGVLLYFSVFAGGNVMHDYYQAIIMPVLAALIARGVVFAFNSSRDFIWPLTPALMVLCVGLMVGLSWYQVREYFNVNNWSMVRAGIKADQILPPDAVVVAPYQGDTAFLYQINRKGWPLIEGNDIKNMIDHRGITHFISLNYDDATNQILQSSEYTVLERNAEYVIVQLRYPNNQ